MSLRSFSVRLAELKDAHEAVEVVRLSIAESCTADHRGDVETVSKWLSNKTVRNFSIWIETQDNYCVVGEAGGRIAGVGLLRRSGEIVLFYLAPNAQGQGLGTAIHSALEKKATAWGLPALTLESTALACRFYERLGYRSAGPAQPRFGVLCAFPYEKLL